MVPALTSISEGLCCDLELTVKPNEPSSPQVPSGQCFITVAERRLKAVFGVGVGAHVAGVSP